MYPLIFPLRYPCSVVPVFNTHGSCIHRRLKSNRSNGKNIHMTIVEKLREYKNTYIIWFLSVYSSFHCIFSNIIPKHLFFVRNMKLRLYRKNSITKVILYSIVIPWKRK